MSSPDAAPGADAGRAVRVPRARLNEELLPLVPSTARGAMVGPGLMGLAGRFLGDSFLTCEFWKRCFAAYLTT